MDLPRPVAGPGELLVRVSFAGVNPFDAKIADGILEGHRPHVFPLVLGVDASGVVEGVGGNVDRFRVGDQVLGQFLHDPIGIGTYAEYSTVPQSIGVARVPDGLSLAEAAALPTAGMTALAALDELGLARNGSVVIVGASGGVGSLATSLAANRGLRVIAIARAGSSDRLLRLGAREVIDPSPDDWMETLRARYPEGVDGLIDLMSDRSGLARIASVVRRGGTVLTTKYVADLAELERSSRRGVNLDLQPNSELIGRLIRQVVDARLEVPVERRVSLPDAPAALAELIAGRGRGKTVVDLSL